MAPFRNRDRSNRSGRGQIEHNVLEGLPIHQYREVEIVVGPNLLDNKPVDKDAWPELPMPRDSHMLPEHSQQLLRAARSGRLLKPPAPPEDDNEMKDEEEEPKEVQTAGFTVRKYVKVARHLEVSEPEYLAKRRKGLPSQYVNGNVVQTALRETKVKKLDADGNIAVYKVLVPEGQAVEGEVQPEDAAIGVSPATAAPGTIVEGVGVVNAEGVVVANDILHPTPPRRRAPPPKKKRGGPGRGKKKVGFVDGAAGQDTPASGTGVDLLSGLKREDDSVAPSDGGDTPMGEPGADDDEGTGDEGSEDEEQYAERTLTPATPSKAPSLPPNEAPTSAPAVDLSNSILEVTPSERLLDATDPAVIATKPAQPRVEGDITSLSASVQENSEHLPIREPSSSPNLPLSATPHSQPNSSTEVPTSVTTTDAIEPGTTVLKATAPDIASEPVLPAPLGVITAAPAEAVVPANSTQETIVAVEPEAAPAPPPNLSPSAMSGPASEPDLLDSLEQQLDKDDKDRTDAQ
ncbi:hypothetical protein ACN47E_000315 [Coniothyrium glycines]